MTVRLGPSAHAPTKSTGAEILQCWLSVVVLVVSGCIGCAGCQWLSVAVLHGHWIVLVVSGCIGCMCLSVVTLLLYNHVLVQPLCCCQQLAALVVCGFVLFISGCIGCADCQRSYLFSLVALVVLVVSDCAGVSPHGCISSAGYKWLSGCQWLN